MGLYEMKNLLPRYTYVSKGKNVKIKGEKRKKD
jgi:hypothetical protein